MFFSIIIPVYQVAPYLRQCLDSVVNQRFRDREIILVDDGSTDGGAAICDEYGEKYPDIRVIHQRNQGLSGARNAGLDAAKGEWILFIDSDDWVVPDMLETLAAEIESCPADLYSFNMRLVDEQGRKLERLIFTPEHLDVRFFDEQERFRFYCLELLRYRYGWEACDRVFRRAIIEEHHLRFRPTKEVYAEDLLFTMEYFLFVEHFRALCYVYYHYRQRSSSLVHSRTAETILPRVDRLAHCMYDRCRQEGFRYFARHFYHIYFVLLDNQIQNTLLAEPEPAALLTKIEKTAENNRWFRKMRRERVNLRKEMVRTQWL